MLTMILMLFMIDDDWWLMIRVVHVFNAVINNPVMDRKNSCTDVSVFYAEVDVASTVGDTFTQERVHPQQLSASDVLLTAWDVSAAVGVVGSRPFAVPRAGVTTTGIVWRVPLLSWFVCSGSSHADAP